ncbi:MAG: alpha-L-rhamnosidase C-terminal domain-containing protein, partial [Solimonas sp.]
ASIDAPQGAIESAWRRGDGKLAYDIGIPGGSEAEIRLPIGTAKAPAAPAGAKLLRSEPGVAIYGAGPGRYHFEIAEAAR